MAERKATFAAGCFWGVEHAFRQVEGVVATRVGFTGGETPRPTYEAVCRKDTGHAEAVEVTYDPGRVSYERLLEVFWRKHDPTRGGYGREPGSGQYRSAIFVHDDDQRASARASLAREQEDYRDPVQTEVVPVGRFFQAEAYHQQYIEKRRARFPTAYAG